MRKTAMFRLLLCAILFLAALYAALSDVTLQIKPVAAQSTTNGTLQVLLPLYSYPDWTDPLTYIWDDVALASKSVSITAIINPDSGPGVAPNTDYQHGMSDLRATGTKMIGYIATDYGNRPIDAVKNEINIYASTFVSYGLSGIFFDQVAPTVDKLNYYQQLYSYTKAISGFNQIILNPGTIIAEEYLAAPAGDVIVQLADTASEWTKFTASSYATKYPTSRFGAVVHDTSTNPVEMRGLIDRALANRVSYIYVTNDTAQNPLVDSPWDTLPSYWSDEISYIAQINSKSDFCGRATDILGNECRALEKLYRSTGGDTWSNRTGWLQSTSACSWYGVTCTNGRVTNIRLYQNNLIGTIPPEIGELTALLTLDMGGNQLSGNIPTQIISLTNLASLSLAFNQLSGALPSTIGNLVNLQVLNLGQNQLTGTIPSSIGNLSKLTNLSLNTNHFSGAIPPELGRLSNLTNVTLRLNQLTSSIPATIGDLKNLTFLSLSENQLSGSIPPEIGNLTKVITLSLPSNRLTGTIPVQIQNLKELRFLFLNTNNLSGPIPPFLGQTGQLESLNLAFNQFNGTIPKELGNLPKLKSLHLGYNRLTGMIPVELGALTNLETLRLKYNQLVGTFPSQLGQLINLKVLDMESNQFSGSLPATLGNLSKLEELSLSSNPGLSGALPLSLSNLSMLKRFWFHDTSMCEPKALNSWLAAFFGSDTLHRTNTACASLVTIQKQATPETLSKADIAKGQQITISLKISSEVNATIRLTETIPIGANLISGSESNGFIKDSGSNRLFYTKSIVAGAELQLSYRITISSESAKGSVFDIRTNLTGKNDSTGEAVQPASASAVVVIPDDSPLSTLFLIYVAADNDLGDEALRLINNAEKALTTYNSNMAIALLLDGPGHDNSYLYYLKPDNADLSCPNYQDPTCGRYRNNESIFEWREESATVESLRDFIVKASAAHPNAEKIVLSLVGHGSGWGIDTLNPQPRGYPDQPGGLLWDEPLKQSLSIAEVRKALQEANQQTKKTLSLLYLDACSMAMSEIAFELTGYANYLLASESLGWAMFPYDQMLISIVDSDDGKAIGEKWLRTLSTSLNNAGKGYPHTYSLIDLSKMSNVANMQKQLANALSQHMQTTVSASNVLSKAVSNTLCFESNFDGKIDLQDNYCDLRSFALQIRTNFANQATIVNRTNDLLAALKTSVVISSNQSGTPWTTPDQLWNFDNTQLGGLSVYLPLEPRADEPRRNLYTASALKWVSETQWADFLMFALGNEEPPTTTVRCSEKCGSFGELRPIAPILQVRPEKPLIQTSEMITVFVELLNNQVGITSIDVDLEYSSHFLTAISCSMFTNNNTICNVANPGIVAITWASQPALISDTVIAKIVFKASNTFTGISPLELHDDADTPSFNLINDVLSIGQSIGILLGDVNCSNNHTSEDARDILRYSVGLVNGYSSCPRPFGTINVNACDVENSKTCNAVDALLVLKCAADVPQTFCQVSRQRMADMGIQKLEMEAPTVFWGQPFLTDNLTPTISLLGNFSKAVGAVEVSIAFDSKSYFVTSCIKGSASVGEFQCNPFYADGVSRFSLISKEGITGTQELATLQLVSPGEPNQILQSLTSALQIQVDTLADIDGSSLLNVENSNSRVFLPFVSR